MKVVVAVLLVALIVHGTQIGYASSGRAPSIEQCFDSATAVYVGVVRSVRSEQRHPNNDPKLPAHTWRLFTLEVTAQWSGQYQKTREWAMSEFQIAETMWSAPAVGAEYLVYQGSGDTAVRYRPTDWAAVDLLFLGHPLWPLSSAELVYLDSADIVNTALKQLELGPTQDRFRNMALLNDLAELSTHGEAVCQALPGLRKLSKSHDHEDVRTIASSLSRYWTEVGICSTRRSN
ncbi:MAG: hypothetical protein ACYSR6_03940 [Planctomycetota bacterium]|jgi:hypothetical protein